MRTPDPCGCANAYQNTEGDNNNFEKTKHRKCEFLPELYQDAARDLQRDPRLNKTSHRERVVIGQKFVLITNGKP